MKTAGATGLYQPESAAEPVKKGGVLFELVQIPLGVGGAKPRDHLGQYCTVFLNSGTKGPPNGKPRHERPLATAPIRLG